MTTTCTRRISIAIRYPVPLVAGGVIHALSREADVDVDLWDTHGPCRADILVTDPATAQRITADGGPEREAAGATSILVLSASGREHEVRSAMQSGVRGYLLANCPVDDLVNCVRVLSAGGRYLSQEVVGHFAASLAHEHLTPRELAVLDLVWRGCSNKLIAKRLCIALGTVKSHVKAILDKLGASNRTQAINVALSRGLVGAEAAA